MIIIALIFGVAFMVFNVAYMLYGDKPILWPYFWRTMYYVTMYGLCFALYVNYIPIAKGMFQTAVLYSIIIFFSEFLIFNLLLINADYVKFKEYINSRVFILFLSYSVAVMLLTVGIIKLIKK
jgi:hypothetical protein